MLFLRFNGLLELILETLLMASRALKIKSLKQRLIFSPINYYVNRLTIEKAIVYYLLFIIFNYLHMFIVLLFI